MPQTTMRRTALGRSAMRLPKLTLAALLIAIVVMFGAWITGADTVTAVEFYNSGLKHYFITADPKETALLDAGDVGKGWTRTGGQFTAYSHPWPGRALVCRFVATPGKGLSPHLLTADANECAMAKQNPDWTYESVAFYIAAPSAGPCPASTYPVWR